MVNQTHKFFSTTCLQRARFSIRTFLFSPFVWESPILCVWESPSIAALSSSSQFPVVVFVARPLQIQNMCRGTWPTDRSLPIVHPSSYTSCHYVSQRDHLRSPLAPKWPTWHAMDTKENFHLPPATETGSPRAPAMLSRREKKRTEGLFLSREQAKIYVGSRVYWHARGFLHCNTLLAQLMTIEQCWFMFSVNCF